MKSKQDVDKFIAVRNFVDTGFDLRFGLFVVYTHKMCVSDYSNNIMMYSCCLVFMLQYEQVFTKQELL